MKHELEFRQISKNFAGVPALTDISFSVTEKSLPLWEKTERGSLLCSKF